MQYSLPKNILYVINTLETAGYEAYLVGGCVRDMLMGITPHDYDITTNAFPNQICDLFEKTIETGIKHGTVSVIIDKFPIEVTTYRTDGIYENFRKPKEVTFVSNINDDLSRRDFTVNAMAYHPQRGILDIFNSINDLNNKTLKAVGDPFLRFKEDALRILRLFRFSSRFDFSIEEKTLDAALKCANELENISKERIFSEICETLMGDYPERILPLINSGGLAFLGLKSTVSLDTIKSLPKNKNLRFFAFARLTGADATALCALLKTDNKLKSFCKNTESVLKDIPNGISACKKMMYLYGEESTAAALILSGKKNIAQEIMNSGQPYKTSHLDIDGNTLKKYGLKGESIGKILAEMLIYVIENPTYNKKDLLVDKFLK